MLSGTVLEYPAPARVGSAGPRRGRHSNNLIEADDASSEADFLSKIGIALREAKESRACLVKIRLAGLDHCRKIAERNLESEAGQLAAVFAAIIRNMKQRLELEGKLKLKLN